MKHDLRCDTCVLDPPGCCLACRGPSLSATDQRTYNRKEA